MKTSLRPSTVACLLGLALLAGGCAGRTSQLILAPIHEHRSFTEEFKTGYISNNRQGEWDIVLLSDATDDSPAPTGDQPLSPVAAAPVRQVLHIHVFWHAGSTAAVAEASLANASIDWCIFGGEGSQSPDLLRYEGAAFADVIDHGDWALVTLKSGRIRRTVLSGSLKDPLGPSLLTGSLRPVRDDARVQQILSGR